MPKLFRALALLCALVGFAAPPAQAAWPDRPVTIIIPWGAGGAADSLARVLAPLFEKEFGVPFNVVNRTGGSGAVGHTAIANAKPDGYTIGLGTVEITMFNHQGLSPITHKDYTVFAIINADAGGLMVPVNSPYKTAKDLLEAIRTKPAGTLKASGTGQGGIWHLGLAGWLIAEGIDPKKVPWVPSQGSAPAMTDLAAGGVDFVTASLPEGRAMIDAKKVMPLANMDTKRLWLYPDVPTIAEATGTKFAILTWRAMLAPKGIPPEVTDRFVPVLKKAHSGKEFQDFMRNQGYGVAWMDPAESVAHMDKAYEEFGRVMKAAGLGK
jgi:tripartite-type tricarboxylate transporter receptor subunit TctC